jgi:hypothetical protein
MLYAIKSYTFYTICLSFSLCTSFCTLFSQSECGWPNQLWTFDMDCNQENCGGAGPSLFHLDPCDGCGPMGDEDCNYHSTHGTPSLLKDFKDENVGLVSSGNIDLIGSEGYYICIEAESIRKRLSFDLTILVPLFEMGSIANFNVLIAHPDHLANVISTEEDCWDPVPNVPPQFIHQLIDIDLVWADAQGLFDFGAWYRFSVDFCVPPNLIDINGNTLLWFYPNVEGESESEVTVLIDDIYIEPTECPDPVVFLLTEYDDLSGEVIGKSITVHTEGDVFSTSSLALLGEEFVELDPGYQASGDSYNIVPSSGNKAELCISKCSDCGNSSEPLAPMMVYYPVSHEFDMRGVTSNSDNSHRPSKSLGPGVSNQSGTILYVNSGKDFKALARNECFKVWVFDTTGRLIIENSSCDIDFNELVKGKSLPSGIYFVYKKFYNSELELSRHFIGG